MEEIIVSRSQVITTRNVEIGDKIAVSLEGLGDFTVTAHKITEKGILFIFDDYVINHPMNVMRTNIGGFDNSDLKKWIDTALFEAFPGYLKERMADLSIPTIGELFGWDDKWNIEHYEPDEDEQLPLMKERRNRIGFYRNKFECGWLRNAAKRGFSSVYFALVGNVGRASYSGASASFGVRPEFWLVK
jgi:hypothetical protein